MRLTPLLLGALLWAAPAASRAADPAPAPAPERFRLDNGLSVVLEPDPSRPRVALAVTYDVGSRDDPPGYRGLAHLLEHLMFATADAASGEGHLELTSQTGGTHNGTTSPDHTTYMGLYPAHQLERALWLEANRMAFMLRDLDQARLEVARAAVLNEWSEREGDGGLRPLLDHARTGAYPEGHPYRDFGDVPDDLRAIGLDTLRWFFQRYYAPHNATLAVVGDFDPAQLKSTIEALFGGIRATQPPAPRPAPRQLDGPKVALDVRLPHRYPRCIYTWLRPREAQRERDAAALLARYLERRLREQLTGDKKLADYVRVALVQLALASELHVILALDEEHDEEAAQQALQAELALVRQGRFDTEVLARERELLRQAFLFSQPDLLTRAVRLGQTPAEAYRSLAQRAADYAALPDRAVARAAQRWLTPTADSTLCTSYGPKAAKTGRLRRRRVVGQRKLP